MSALSGMRKGTGIKKSDNALRRLTGRFVKIRIRYPANGRVINPVQTPRGGSD